jgi:hypothetical protein
VRGEVVDLSSDVQDGVTQRVVLRGAVGVGDDDRPLWLGPGDVLDDRQHRRDAGAGAGEEQWLVRGSTTKSPAGALTSSTSPIATLWYESVDPSDQRSAQGWMDLTALPLPQGVSVFTCGPLPFMRHVRAQLLARGVPAERIRYEVFGPDLWTQNPPE